MKPERRQLLKAGVWTLPVVAVATSAPAYAASGANMSGSSAPAPTRSATTNYSGSVTLRNSGTATTSALTISVNLGTSVAPSLLAHTPPSGFIVTSAVNNVVTFTATQSAQVDAGVTVGPLTYVVVRGNNGQSGSQVTITIDPGDGGTVGTFGPYTVS